MTQSNSTMITENNVSKKAVCEKSVYLYVYLLEDTATQEERSPREGKCELQ